MTFIVVIEHRHGIAKDSVRVLLITFLGNMCLTFVVGQMFVVSHICSNRCRYQTHVSYL